METLPGASPTILFQVLHSSSTSTSIVTRTYPYNRYLQNMDAQKKNNDGELTKKTGEPNSNTKLRNDTEVQF